MVTVAMPHRLYRYSYDFDQYNFLVSLLARRFGLRVLWERALQVLWEIRKEWHKALELKPRIRLARSADLYVRIWGGIPFDREVLQAIEGGPTRVTTLLMGCDVRDHDVFRKEYVITHRTFPPVPWTFPLKVKLQNLRTHERYADAIFSVPDQMGLALRPYHHLHVPLHLEKFRYVVPGRAVPRVVHSPSVPQAKGTDIIEAALETLRGEGVAFELISVRDVPHEDLLSILSDADVVVDQLIFHGPAWLSFEAMASGCATATRYLEDSPACFRPPVWGINERNIVDRLRTLLTDRDLRLRLAEDGRSYVEAHNRIEHVVDRMLEKVEAGRGGVPDYVPTYLTTQYIPIDDKEAATINAETDLVSGETWYRDHVVGRTHDGLVF